MKATTIFGAFAASVILAIPACGGGGDGGGGGQSSAEKVFTSRYAELYCSGVVPCCQAVFQANDVQTCRTATVMVGLGFSGGQFDSAQADQCISALEGWDCNQGIPDACNRVYRGTVEPGAACSDSRECVRPPDGSAICSLDPGSTNGVCKTIPTPAAGQPCGSNAITATEQYFCDQDPSLFCDTTTFTCKARVAIGQPCQGAECVVGATCDTTSSSPGQCVADAPIGADCMSLACQGDAYCDPTTNLCVAKKSYGEPCTSLFECPEACDSGVCSHTKPIGVACVTSGA